MGLFVFDKMIAQFWIQVWNWKGLPAQIPMTQLKSKFLPNYLYICCWYLALVYVVENSMFYPLKFMNFMNFFLVTLLWLQTSPPISYIVERDEGRVRYCKD